MCFNVAIEWNIVNLDLTFFKEQSGLGLHCLLRIMSKN